MLSQCKNLEGLIANTYTWRGGGLRVLIIARCGAGECAQDLQAEPLRQPGRDRVAHLVRSRVRVRVVGLPIWHLPAARVKP